MIATPPSPRERVEQCRKIAQHIADPAIRLAMLNQMRLLEQELEQAPAPTPA